MDIIEAIEGRRSVRNYNGAGLTDRQRAELELAVENSFSPFGGHVTIRLKRFDLSAGYRPGTYGMIRGADDFFLLGMGTDEESALTAGFRFEQVVLRAWQMGLGTCWIAATFKESDFDSGESWPPGESLKIVSPVGTPSGKSLMERVTRLVLGSTRRKPFDTLFHYGAFGRRLPSGHRFGKALEMMRLAPSSTNSQPWRALVEDDAVHFFYKPVGAVTPVDCGIGLCHFYLTERAEGREGRFEPVAEVPPHPRDLKYLISYK